MSIFDTVTLTWKGKDYVIPPHHTLRAIARVEEVITIQELIQYGQRGTAPVAKLAQAFASVLRFAGASVTDEEVYAGMFSGDSSPASIPVAIQSLLSMMVPKEVPKLQGVPGGKPVPAVVSSSKSASKPRSGMNGSPHKTSGN